MNYIDLFFWNLFITVHLSIAKIQNSNFSHIKNKKNRLWLSVFSINLLFYNILLLLSMQLKTNPHLVLYIIHLS